MRWISNSPWCVRAWRGELDLPVTFSLIGLVGMAAVVSLNVAASMAETAQNGDRLQWILVLPTAARHMIEAVTLFFITVCVRRSARRYEGPAAWASRARAAIMCMTVGLGVLPTSVVSREFSATKELLVSYLAKSSPPKITAQNETAAEPVLSSEQIHEQELSIAPAAPSINAPSKPRDHVRRHRKSAAISSSHESLSKAFVNQ